MKYHITRNQCFYLTYVLQSFTHNFSLKDVQYLYINNFFQTLQSWKKNIILLMIVKHFKMHYIFFLNYYIWV